MWVVKNPDDEPGFVTGYEFQSMKPSYEDDEFSFAELHSYVVTDISDRKKKWPIVDLVGKGSCLFLGTNASSPSMSQDFRTPNPDQRWLFEILDHCIDYTSIRRKPSRGRTRPRC